MHRPSTMAAFTAALIILSAVFTTSTAHNISHILSQTPEFSTFNHYLTLTHLASEIDRHTTITVLAVNNAAMDDLIAKDLSISTVKNILSLHVLVDYFGPKKLHQITNGTALVSTLYQASGSAPGASGLVNITDLRGGRVGFGAHENDGTLPAVYVKSVKEIPYNISVVQISQIIPSAAAEAPTAAPKKQNLTEIMSKHGCKIFADTLSASPEAYGIFSDNLDGGLTIFCPADDAFKGFLPKFKNLTAAGKIALLEFHGVPIYQSIASLKSNNGVMNTLATDGAEKYDFTVQNDGDEITLKTKLVTARITNTIIDEQPLAIFTISKVLLPEELFKADAPSPSPAPAPEPADADAPAPAAEHKKKKKKAADAPSDDESDSPADSPEDAADDTADDSGAVRFGGMVALVLALAFGILTL
ncbi:fasciclin-like arabinogalactan protein 1 [Vicia villosa]|uniref:fasciclin-like arabinogalactan protein 1 n=1 Tax=Vicia villosa TaxID=3911 RepID=UPI00273C3D56|nr:fasciclin-like arabinogalactan protein 1 [Vicia villosa]